MGEFAGCEKCNNGWADRRPLYRYEVRGETKARWLCRDHHPGIRSINDEVAAMDRAVEEER